MNKYGERINEKLAYRIARNQVNRYLIERRKKGLTMVPTGVTPSVSQITPAKDENGEELGYSTSAHQVWILVKRSRSFSASCFVSNRLET
jgi:hypothetical protein